MFSKEILSKERFVPCSVRHDLTEKMNLVSFFVAVAVPTLAGPVLCPIVHLVLTFCHCCCLPCVGSRAVDAATANSSNNQDDEDAPDTW